MLVIYFPSVPFLEFALPYLSVVTLHSASSLLLCDWLCASHMFLSILGYVAGGRSSLAVLDHFVQSVLRHVPCSYSCSHSLSTSSRISARWAFCVLLRLFYVLRLTHVFFIPVFFNLFPSVGCVFGLLLGR